MVKKFEIPENANLAKACVGTGIGATIPLVLKLYADPLAPDGVPIVNTVIPSPWNKVSVFGSLLLGAGSLIAGVLIKPLRYALIPMGISSVCVGAMLGITTPPNLAAAAPNVRLKSAAPGGAAPGVSANYNPKNDLLASSRNPNPSGGFQTITREQSRATPENYPLKWGTLHPDDITPYPLRS